MNIWTGHAEAEAELAAEQKAEAGSRGAAQDAEWSTGTVYTIQYTVPTSDAFWMRPSWSRNHLTAMPAVATEPCAHAQAHVNRAEQ